MFNELYQGICLVASKVHVANEANNHWVIVITY